MTLSAIVLVPLSDTIPVVHRPADDEKVALKAVWKNLFVVEGSAGHYGRVGSA